MLRIVLVVLGFVLFGLAYPAEAACKRGWVSTRGGCMPRGATDCGGSSYCARGSICIKGGCLSRNSPRLCPGGKSHCPPAFICTRNHTCLSILDERVCSNGSKYCNEGEHCVDNQCVPVSSETAEADCMSDKADVAIRGCSQLISTESDPKKRAQAHVNRGVAYANKNDEAKAIAEYTEAIRLDPTYALPHWNRGKLYQNDEKLDLALADAMRFVELKPADYEAYGWRAFLYEMLSKDDEALADYKEAVRLEPSDNDLFARLGAVYQRLGKYEEAIDSLTKALEGDWSEPRLLSRAQVHFDNKAYDKAIADCNRALALDFQYDLCYQLRGDALLQKGEHHKARADVEKAIRLVEARRPTDEFEKEIIESVTLPYMYALKGDVHAALGERKEAIAAYRKTLKAYEGHQRAVDGLKRLGVAVPRSR